MNIREVKESLVLISSNHSDFKYGNPYLVNMFLRLDTIFCFLCKIYIVISLVSFLAIPPFILRIQHVAENENQDSTSTNAHRNDRPRDVVAVSR